MSNINLIIEERPSNIGNFLVGRLLPFREKRMVGPFAFIDHMGPVALNDHENLDVGPHPHIGLSTLTYLFEGSIMHRDSLGTVVEIKPGQVNWMTAGNGIVHSERTPDYLRTSEKMLHGLQIWVALPKHLENIAPSFTHIDEDEMPVWDINGIKAKLIAGEAFGKKSPVPVYSPLYFIELKSTDKTTISIGNELYGESAIYILDGSIKIEGATFSPKQLLVAKETSLCEFTMNENTIIYIFGGEPFAEPRHIYWNFVASTRAAIEEAKERWVAQKFPTIPNETGYVPLPEQNTNFKLKN
ncbi:pirin family protein [Flavobacterium arcticum]|uniref:Pirin family protein n=1 Tax=Flavobacterium arcticum TaxID=1784713 RepID=A0A345H8H7_9FLAO|nr:pirin family protein [Flavobacterium arcticum]AXG72887.1 pirin family protein [Flavobacterium arcticum]KAF2510449.1 pirin family protein [Flavobacterium arcticum]